MGNSIQGNHTLTQGTQSVLMKTTLFLIIPLLLLPPWVLAINLGIHGRVYDIEENDLLKVLQSRAQAQMDSGKWDIRVEEWRNHAKQQANRPEGIHLPRATKITSHLYDPSIIVPIDIVDTSGRLIQPAGTKANPLHYIAMTRDLVFIDGDDSDQVDWMREITKTEPDHYKVILTKGAVIELMKEFNRRFFFDQQQIYTEKLAIKSLPALVYQEGLFLRIDEVVIP